MTEPFRLRYVSQLVGGFILTTMILLLLFVIYLLRVKEVFIASLPYDMVIKQHELDGLRQGTEVFILGRLAGRITEIAYETGSTDLRINLTLKETFRDSLFDDSVVRLRRRFGVGEPYLEILRGPASARPLRHPQDGGPARFLNFIPEQDRLDVVETQLDRVRSSVERVEQAMVPALSSIQRAANTTTEQVESNVGPAAVKAGESSEMVARSAARVQQKMDETLNRIEDSAAEFDSHLRQVTSAVKSVERDSLETSARVRHSAEEFSESIQAVQNKANSAFDEFETASKEMNSLMRDSQAVVRDLKSETEDLTGTAIKANDAAGGAQDLVNGLKQHWLLRRYMKPNSPTRTAPAAGVRGPD